MAYRYFILMSGGEPINLRRWTPETEERWQDGKWVLSDVIGAYLALGEGDYDEITTELAIETFPEAFNKEQYLMSPEEPPCSCDC